MKSTLRLCFWMLTAICISFIAGCNKDHSQNIPDPNGTKAQNLFNTYPAFIDTVNAMYSANGNNISFYKNPVYINLELTSIILFSYDSTVNQQNNQSWIGGCNSAISNLGSVSCLGAITSHPDTGYVSEITPKIGMGYVVKLTDNDPATSTLVNPIPRTRYYRLYISGAATGSNGTPSGYAIKYQGPF